MKISIFTPRWAVASACVAALSLMSVAGATAQLAQAQASELTSASYRVKAASSPAIRVGYSAFNKGEFAVSIAYNRQALKSGLSKSRKAIAYNNLCAALAADGQYDEAVRSCDKAVALKPKMQEAVHNLTLAQTASKTMLAQSNRRGVVEN